MKIKSLGKALIIAKQIFNNREKIKEVYNDSTSKATDNKDKMSSGLWSDVKTLQSMLKAILKGSYKVPKKTTLYVIAGLLYFINPLDLMPDFIFGLGFLDDAAVLAFVIKKLKKEIDNFRKDHTFQEVEVLS